MGDEDDRNLLHANGTFAVPWFLGNTTGKVKKNSQMYKRVLQANIAELCEGVERLLRDGRVEAVPRPRIILDCVQASFVYLGLRKMYLVKLTNFKVFLEDEYEKIKFKVPQLNQIDQPEPAAGRKSAKKKGPTIDADRLNLSSSFGEITMAAFDRLHETIDDLPAPRGMSPRQPSPPLASVAEVDFDAVFHEFIEQQRLSKGRKTTSKRHKRPTDLTDDALLTMLKSTSFVTANENISIIEDVPLGETRPAHEEDFFGEFEDQMEFPVAEAGQARPSVEQPIEVDGPEAVFEAVEPITPATESQSLPPAPPQMGSPLAPVDVGGTLASRIQLSRPAAASRSNQVQQPSRKRVRTREEEEEVGFRRDEGDLHIPKTDLRQWNDALKRPTPIDQLLQKAREQRASLVEPIPRRLTPAMQIRKILKTRGMPLGGRLANFVDKLEAETLRRIGRDPSGRKTRGKRPIEPPPDPMQDEFDRNIAAGIEGLEIDPAPIESAGFEVTIAGDAPTAGSGSPGGNLSVVSDPLARHTTPVGATVTAVTPFTDTRAMSRTPGTALTDTRGTSRPPSTMRGSTAAATPAEASGAAPRRPGDASNVTDGPAQEQFETAPEFSAMDIDVALETDWGAELQRERSPDEPEYLRYKTFRQLFPPETTPRRKAAEAFQRLLQMQAQRKVLLIQNEFCGEIYIKPLN